MCKKLYAGFERSPGPSTREGKTGEHGSLGDAPPTTLALHGKWHCVGRGGVSEVEVHKNEGEEMTRVAVGACREGKIT